MLNKGVSLLAVAPCVENTVALNNTAPFSPALWQATNVAPRPSHKGDTVTARRARADGIPQLPVNKTSSQLQCQLSEV